jgi:hypothetical protein
MQPHEDEADVARRHDADSHGEGSDADHGVVHRAQSAPVSGGGRVSGHARQDLELGLGYGSDGEGVPMDEEEAAIAAAIDAARARRLERRDRDRDARDRGRLAALDQGRVEALRAALLVFVRTRLAPLSAETAAAIAALADEGELTELVDTLVLTESADEARAVLDAALSGNRT